MFLDANCSPLDRTSIERDLGSGKQVPPRESMCGGISTKLRVVCTTGIISCLAGLVSHLPHVSQYFENIVFVHH